MYCWYFFESGHTQCLIYHFGFPFDNVQVNEMNVSTQFNYILALINCIGNLFKLGGMFLFRWDSGKLISVSPLFVYHILQ